MVTHRGHYSWQGVTGYRISKATLTGRLCRTKRQYGRNLSCQPGGDDPLIRHVRICTSFNVDKHWVSRHQLSIVYAQACMLCAMGMIPS